MIRKIFDWVMSPMGRIAVLITVLSLFSLAAYGLYQTQQPPEQPIQFTHKLHVGLGIQCLYCHPGALRGPSPGLPTINKCWGCHQQIAKTQTSERLKPMVDAMSKGEGFVWIPVAQVPEFVQFNHRPHVAAGVNCEVCHGDFTNMDMGWCLNCHKEKAGDDQEKLIKLTDCGTCHY
jgi:hypothetical protein